MLVVIINHILDNKKIKYLESIGFKKVWYGYTYDYERKQGNITTTITNRTFDKLSYKELRRKYK
jgi:hypothetical protein